MVGTDYMGIDDFAALLVFGKTKNFFDCGSDPGVWKNDLDARSLRGRMNGL